MNTLKRTLALVATLSMSATAFVACGSSSSSSSSKKDTATTGAATTGEATTGAATEAPTKAAETGKPNSTTLGDVKLKTGGSQFTVGAWNHDDAPYLKDLWVADGGDASKWNFIEYGCGGGESPEHIDAQFQAGGDFDLYFCEADWALNYINDDSRTAPLEDLGFTEDNFSDVYGYTTEIGRATAGANAGKMVGATWQSCPGGFAYRTDIAEKYLGVKTPEEMQAAIADWDKFVDSASKIAEATDGKVALADSLGGMWQVFAANRTTPWVSGTRLTIDDSCETFANYAKKLWDNGGVTKNGQWTPDWIPAGKDGSAVGYFVSTWGFGDGAFFGDASSESRGQWKVVQGPAPYFWGGTWLVVNPKTDSADDCQKFIFNACVNPETMAKMALEKPEYVNNKSVMNDIVEKNKCPNDFVTNNLGGQNYFAELHENAKNINLKGLITPYDATCKGAFLDELTKLYLEGGKSYEDAVDQAIKDIYAKAPDLAK